ncbi:MAG: hypothetical protein HFE58_10300 [Firmicutes bacterium]|jgi:hypothetical protein|nr:hypothetical protein [Bacillota bacterium]
MEQLQKRLLKLKIKLVWELWLKIFLKCSVIGTAISVVYVLISKWRYLFDDSVFFVIVILAVLFCSCIVTYLKRVTWQKTAKIADKLGYKERFITALELLEQKREYTKVEKLVIEDALQKAQQCDISKEYKLTIPKKEIKILVVLFVALFGTNIITTPQQKQAEQYAAAQLKKIEQVKSEINKEQEIKEDALKAFNKEMNTLTKNLKKAQTVEESKKIVEQAQQAVKALEKENMSEDLKKVSEKLSQNEKTKDLANALETGDTKAINMQMDMLLSEMEDLPQEVLEKIAQALDDIGEINDEELAELLENLSQQLSSGNMTQAITQGQALKGKLASLANENTDFVQNMENLNQALAENVSSKTEQSGQSGQQGDGQGQGQGEGEQSGSGQGGQGQGSGEGMNSGQGRGSGHQETEKIYTRKAENMSGYQTQLQGQQNEQGQTNITREQTIGERGQSLPYEQVYQSYRNNALRDIENSDVPYGMRELVSEYFSTLEQ